MNDILIPMRPGVDLKTIAPGWSIPGWTWQPKIDDERAVLRVSDGQVFNRHGQEFDQQKLRAFGGAVQALRRQFASYPWVDMGLIGFRDRSAFGESRGAILVFDLVTDDPFPWEARAEWLRRAIPTLDLCAGEKAVPGMVYRFQDESQPSLLFERTKNVPGLEGVIGRNVRACYCQGDSREMAKARWKRG